MSVLTATASTGPAWSTTPTVTSITFGAGNAFNNYATTTWTPVLTFGAGGVTGITYSRQNGKYTQIGNILYFAVDILLTSKGSSTGAASITGLPTAATAFLYGGGVPLYDLITFTTNYTEASWNANNTATLSLTQSGSGQTDTSITNTNLANTTRLVFCGFYTTA